MPDALSTTIPIWCAVLNRTLLPSHPLSSQLFLPPHLLPTTHAQITALIPQFVKSFEDLNLQSLPVLTKPLRPYWITQDSALPSEDVIYESYRPVICLTASRRTPTSEIDSNGYIQGAADDTENWAHGLTSSLFWAHKDQLLSTTESELPDLIASLIDGETTTADTVVQLTPFLAVAALPAPKAECLVSLTNETTPKEEWIRSGTEMVVGLGKNKTASRNLRTALPDICDFVSRYLQGHPHGKVTIPCASGTDTSVGTALALSCYLFDEEGRFRVPDGEARVTKPLVKRRLGGMMTVFPGGNPSRQTLQSVNSFLMDWRR